MEMRILEIIRVKMELKRGVISKGFTLLETVMVLVITGILLAAVAPTLTSYFTWWELDTEARKIAAKIRETQAKAIRNQSTFRLVFLADTDNYRIESCSWGSCWTEATVMISGRDIHLMNTSLPYQDFSTPPPDQTIPPGNVLTFDQFGAASAATFPSPMATIILTTRDNMQRKTIYINKITGTVMIR